MTPSQAKPQAQDLLNFIDASPSPWHAVDTSEQRLLKAGFIKLNEALAWQLQAGGSYYAVRGGASIIAFSIGKQALTDSGFRIIGAHTDSPGLRLKPNAAYGSDGLVRIAVEVYGGPNLATFTDRDTGKKHTVEDQGRSGWQQRPGCTRIGGF